MTEELKQKAEEYAITYGIGDNFNVSEFIDFAVKFAQQETDILSQHIVELQKDKGNLIDRVKELEQQIEKMKEKTVSLCEGCVRLPMLYKEKE